MDYSSLFQPSNGVLGSGGQISLPFGYSGSGPNPTWGNNPTASSPTSIYSGLGASSPVLTAGNAGSQLPNLNMTGQGNAGAQSPSGIDQWTQLINLLMGKLGSSPGQSGSIFGGSGLMGGSMPSSVFGSNSGMYSR